MKSPEIFIPKYRLELPMDADDETTIISLTEHKLIRFGFDAINIMRMRFPILPSWREWEDSKGGVLQLTDASEGVVVPTATIDGDGRQSGAYSTDGITVHADRPTLVTFNVVGEDQSIRKVFWGVVSHELEEVLDGGDHTKVMIRDPWWNGYYEHFYPASR
jgi:hypothetical protein